MLTVPEAAQRAARDPETIRRWIRSGKLRARKVGTQHVIEETDLDAIIDVSESQLLPRGWRYTRSRQPMPEVVAAIARSRRGH